MSDAAVDRCLRQYALGVEQLFKGGQPAFIIGWARLGRLPVRTDNLGNQPLLKLGPGVVPLFAQGDPQGKRDTFPRVLELEFAASPGQSGGTLHVRDVSLGKTGRLFFLSLNSRHSDHRIPRDNSRELIERHLLRAGRSLRQDHIAGLEGAVPDLNPDAFVQLKPELPEHLARPARDPGAIRLALIPERRQTQDRPGVTRA